MAWIHRNGLTQLYINLFTNGKWSGWKPYTSFPQLAKPDYAIPGGSKGYQTYQILLKAGFTLISTEKANSEFSSQSIS